MYELILEKYNPLIVLLIFIILNGLIYILVLNWQLSTKNDSEYLNVNTGRPNVFKAYFMPIIKSRENVLLFIMVGLAYLVMLVKNVDYGLIVFVLPCFSNYYNVIKVDPIRYNLKKVNSYYAKCDYGILFMSANLVNWALLLPFAILALVKGVSLGEVIGVFGLIAFVNACILLVGIMFPAKHDNPFGAMFATVISVVIAVILITLLSFMATITRLIIVVLVILLIMIVSLSIKGLENLYGEGV